MTDFAAIILAAGKGTRMKSSVHKVLHPIAGKPMLMHILDEFEVLKPKQTVVVVGDRREQIDASIAGRDVVTALQDPQHGTAHAALQAKAALQGFSGHVLVTFGDVPMVTAATVERLLAALAEGAKVAVLGFKPEDALAYGRIIADDDGTVHKMVEFKDATEREKKTRMCNSGLIVAHSDDMWPLLEAVDNDNAQGEYYLPDVATGAIARGDKVVVIECEPDEVAGINSRAELAEAEQRWQAARRVEAMDEGATLKAPDTVFFSHDTKLGRDVTIDPHVVFGPGVTVADDVHVKAYTHLEGATLEKGAQAGPFARLRPGAVMEEGSFVGNFVEMKKATLGPGAKASHLSYIGDATVGKDANIGAGTITCNYDGYFKYQTVIGDRAFIGSNSALIAPVTIGPDAIVAAGSAVSRDVGAGDLRMVRAEQLVKQGWADRFHDAMKKKKAAQKNGSKKS
ncbi:bifunctional UDP-N-acetylglucosamine diphosphorylase/glucosamine-1-phosphate N-acetyltransferase GlmU [Qipengyuania sp. S6317L1]|uniref:bifunctional UDP-N-acetylglucosamine diphosphorylase/glucosamine-1-phosphate N-acetyltransferase GlmU n=1 Tax=Qipengyuania sp. S6317L1 TaxID=2926410 RepID=UPI001FF310A8|nr:bifunctional UDP-N-acetylglucosamine diphosphorylase/glucosamine-1-phosphate N-acetyltransferase GlmU [Qipengyuania sp. S6317L1]MCK0098126.1 bifunctional UDP-N-acetylglucosamine diphosphorylase/glucosamine-1-phosphate N-acetyltransferase GlmU [Qipengyuania sp. S6317L1]